MGYGSCVGYVLFDFNAVICEEVMVERQANMDWVREGKGQV